MLESLEKRVALLEMLEETSPTEASASEGLLEENSKLKEKVKRLNIRIKHLLRTIDDIENGVVPRPLPQKE